MPVMPTLSSPAQEGSLSPALIDQPSSNTHEPALDLAPPLTSAESADQVGHLGLQIGLSTLAGNDIWTSSFKDDPWGAAPASKIASASMIAEPDSSTMQLDGDSCCMSLGGAIAASEDETVHGESYIYASSLNMYHPYFWSMLLQYAAALYLLCLPASATCMLRRQSEQSGVTAGMISMLTWP